MMADALVEFETITAEQIDDIMAGAKPRAPGDIPPPPASGRGSPQPKPGKPGETPIGGPAEEH
jgi:cell division protease FtsH